MSRAFKWIVGVLLALLVVGGGATAAYATYFSDRALPGTTVAGQSVSKMNHKQIVESVEKRASDLTTQLTIDGKKYEPTLADLGVKVDAEATADAALAPNKSVWSRITGLFGKKNIPAVATVDEQVLDTFQNKVVGDLSQPAKDATVQFDPEAQAFVVEPASEGTGVDDKQILEFAKNAGAQLSPINATLDSTASQPSVTTEEANKVADEANQLMHVDVEISTGNREIAPTIDDIASWISIEKTDGKLQGPKISEENVTKWVQTTAESTNDEPVDGIHNINSRGDVVSTPDEGTPGYYVNNADQVAKELYAALQNGESYSGLFEYDQVEQEFTTREIADGAENLAYQAAPGEKWIDIDLANNTVSAYEGATIVRGPVYMVPGAPETPTVTGTFRVYLQYASQTMRGENVDGSRYEVPDVPWVTYFHGGYALHGAPWHSHFGWSGPGGSHGCINMPVGEAQWFYDWAEIGTIVVSHY